MYGVDMHMVMVSIFFSVVFSRLDTASSIISDHLGTWKWSDNKRIQIIEWFPGTVQKKSTKIVQKKNQFALTSKDTVVPLFVFIHYL